MDYRIKKTIELREKGEKREALKTILGYLEEFPKDPFGNYQCGWCHDVLELEVEAIKYYLAAIDNGLSGSDLEGTYLGLGSTYRSIGEYEKSQEIFLRGIKEFPENKDLLVFYAMTLYNLGKFNKGMEILLKVIADTSCNKDIQTYKKAILFYSDKLDKTFN